MDNPTESDIENYSVKDKDIRILESGFIMLNIFNMELFESKVTVENYKTSDAEDSKIEAKDKTICQTTVKRCTQHGQPSY